jgi:CRP-like cAMP-binding protein
MQAYTANVSRLPTAAVIVMKGAAAMPGRNDNRTANSAGVRRTLVKGEELFAEGDAADHFYKVVSGTVRTCKLLSDGRRQIDEFHLAGDIFGLEPGEEHRFSAEAVGDATVLAFRRRRFETLARDDPALGGEVMTSMMRSLERAHDHMVLLGRKTAQEKIATLAEGFFVPLALVVLAPVSINIFLVHAFLAPSGLPLAVAVGAALIYLAFFSPSYSPVVKVLFVMKSGAAR